MTTATSATTATIHYPSDPVEIIDRDPSVRAVTEASDLGWVPGWWPATVLFYDVDEPPVILFATVAQDADLVDYVADDASIVLTVYND